MVVAIKSADEEAVDNPWEVGALLEGAVDAKSAWAASAGRGAEGDGLVVAQPHQEVCNHCFLLVQPGRKISAARDKRVSFVDQVARGYFGEGLLLRRFPSGLCHQRRQSGKIMVLWSHLIDDLLLQHKFLFRKEVSQVSKPSKPLRFGGWLCPQGERPPHAKGAVGSANRCWRGLGRFLTQSKPAAGKIFIWCSLPYGPQTHLT